MPLPDPPVYPPSDPTVAPTLQCFVGPQAAEKDVVNYVRYQLGDEAGYEYADAVFATAIDEVVTDFSRCLPAEYIVGNPLLDTSPLVTVEGQRSYALSTGNGFTPAPLIVMDVLYRASGSMSNVSEFSYMSLMAMAPLSRFFAGPDSLDSPSARVLLDSYASEAAKWGVGYWKAINGPDGLSVEVLPVPGDNGSPIFVRYGAQHTATTVGDADHYYTVPQLHWRDFAKLLQAEVLERSAMRALRRGQLVKLGLNTRNVDSKLIMDEVTGLRQSAYQSLGATSTYGTASD